jgi:hyperosmotically inducible protein
MHRTAASVLLLLLAMGTAAAQTPASQEKPATPPAEKQDRTLGKVLSDGWITMKIHSLYITEDALDHSNIDVDTRNGVVTLSGTVVTDAGRKRAVEVARTTDGVKSVIDTALRIAPEPSGTTGAAEAGKRAGRAVNDGWMKSKIYAQFLTEDFLNDSDIDVDVAKGMVTLSGTVRTQAGRERAEAVAKSTEGVKGVKNGIKVSAK